MLSAIVTDTNGRPYFTVATWKQANHPNPRSKIPITAKVYTFRDKASIDALLYTPAKQADTKYFAALKTRVSAPLRLADMVFEKPVYIESTDAEAGPFNGVAALDDVFTTRAGESQRGLVGARKF